MLMFSVSIQLLESKRLVATQVPFVKRGPDLLHALAERCHNFRRISASIASVCLQPIKVSVSKNGIHTHIVSAWVGLVNR